MARELNPVCRQQIGRLPTAARDLATGRTSQGEYVTVGMVQAGEARDASKAALMAGLEAVRQQRPNMG